MIINIAQYILMKGQNLPVLTSSYYCIAMLSNAHNGH